MLLPSKVAFVSELVVLASPSAERMLPASLLSGLESLIGSSGGMDIPQDELSSVHDARDGDDWGSS